MDSGLAPFGRPGMTEAMFMPLLDTSAHGVYIIAATPFTEDGAVDTASLDRLMDFYVRRRHHRRHRARHHGRGAEAHPSEAVALTRQVVRRVNGLPVIVGVSSPGFASMGALTKDVMDAGAGGVMIAPPCTLKTDDQIVAYFAQRRGGDRRRRAVRDPGLSLCVRRLHGAVGHQAHRERPSVLPRW